MAERIALDERAGRPMLAEIGLPGRVDLVAIIGVGQVKLDIGDVLEPHAGSRQHRPHVLVHLLGLLCRIASPDNVVLAIEPALPGGEQEIAAQHRIGVMAERLAQCGNANLFARSAHDVLPPDWLT